MIGIDTIQVKIKEGSQLHISKVRTVLENKLRDAASATNFKSYDYEEKVDVLLGKTISLQTINQILHAFSKARISIKSFSWEERKVGPIRRGRIEIVVS